MSAPFAEDNSAVIHGFENLGNTCHFNSTLQALCAFRDFPAFVLNQRRKRSDNHLHNLLRSMALGVHVRRDSLEFAMRSLGSPFNEINPRTNIRYQQDASECFQKMFEQLGSKWMLPYQGNYRSRQNPLWEPFFVLPLHLSSNITSNFDDMIGDAGIVIDKAPSWLVVHLMRFAWKEHHLEKNIAHVIVPQEFTLPTHGNNESHYCLCASVNHVGSRADSGHYTCICRRLSSQMLTTWWKCTDHVVMEVDSHKSVSGSECYLLFFEKVGAPSNEKVVHERKEHESFVCVCEQKSNDLESDESTANGDLWARRKKHESFTSSDVNKNPSNSNESRVSVLESIK